MAAQLDNYIRSSDRMYKSEVYIIHHYIYNTLLYIHIIRQVSVAALLDNFIRSSDRISTEEKVRQAEASMRDRQVRYNHIKL